MYCCNILAKPIYNVATLNILCYTNELSYLESISIALQAVICTSQCSQYVASAYNN